MSRHHFCISPATLKRKGWTRMSSQHQIMGFPWALPCTHDLQNPLSAQALRSPVEPGQIPQQNLTSAMGGLLDPASTSF